jgi:hypothetical protein
VSNFGQIGNRLTQTHSATASMVDPIEHFFDGWPVGQSLQFTYEVLLQRLPLIFGAPLQLGVYLIGEISDQYVGHAFNMLSCTG